MDLLLDDTIAALASAPGSAVRSIIRISGDATREILERVFESGEVSDQLTSRFPRRYSGRFHVESLRVPIPGDVYFWPTRRSYTGQPTAELHLVGSPPLIDAVLAALYRSGARPARPGEFTLRAFLAGKIDLTQAEAVLGVIDAGEQQELDRALQQLAGGISGKIGRVHSDLVELLADLEAGLDFVEEDIEFVTQEEITKRLQESKQTLLSLLDSATGRMMSGGSLRVLLAGLPNAGKSTLFNALLERDAALVSPESGTTRDYLQATLHWDELSVELIDTAGWESSTAGIAAAAQDSKDDQIARADILLWCTAADLDVESRRQDDEFWQRVRATGSPVLRVRTKCDRANAKDVTFDVSLSAVTGQGIADLKFAIHNVIGSANSDGTGLLGTTAARCRRSLDEAITALQRAEEAVASQLGDDLVAAEIRAALEPLGEIVGRVYTDDILGRIFSKFCIGK